MQKTAENKDGNATAETEEDGGAGEGQKTEEEGEAP